MFRIVTLILFVGLGAMMAYLRLVPSDPEEWHVDSRSVARPGTVNFWLVRPVDGDAMPPHYPIDAEELATMFDRVALARPATVRLAGSVASGRMTYLTRTRWMGFPDYVSVTVYPTDGGSSLAVFSRSRFGSGDRGMNRNRMALWLAALDREVKAKLTSQEPPV